jgi:hypothetical protein
VADLVTPGTEEDAMRERALSRRVARAALLLLVLAAAACQTSGGMGLDVQGSGPGWAPFSGGRMFGAPM